MNEYIVFNNWHSVGARRVKAGSEKEAREIYTKQMKWTNVYALRIDNMEDITPLENEKAELIEKFEGRQ